MYSRNSGVTLIELMVTLAVLAIVVTVAIPSFEGMMTRQRLKSATEAVYQDLRWARTETIKRNERITVEFDTTAPDWCYGITDSVTETCNCATAGSCTVDGIGKTVNASSFPKAAVTSADFTPGDPSTTFDPVRGTAAAGKVTITAGAYTAEVVVNMLGRVRVCSDDSALGYPACS